MPYLCLSEHPPSLFLLVQTRLPWESTLPYAPSPLLKNAMNLPIWGPSTPPRGQTLRILLLLATLKQTKATMT